MYRRILLSRDPDRVDHLRHVYEATKGCEVYNLYKKFRPPTPNDKRNLYWTDFKSPYEVLSQIKPEKIVFSDIETFYEVALNVAARRAGIPTFVLEHGLRHAEEVQAAHAAPEKPVVMREDFRSLKGIWSRLHTLIFFLSVLKDCNAAEKLDLLRFLYHRSVNDMTVALSGCRFELRLADRYINFSEGNTAYLRARDGVEPDRFVLIGNPALDDFFQPSVASETAPEEPFFLLIDSPLVEVPSIGMPESLKADFLRKLATFAASEGAKLFVKLHPYSYIYGKDVGYLPTEDNIVYLRDVSIASLVVSAKGCFGILSTLLTVVPCVNRCIIFTLPNQPFQEELLGMRVAGSLDFFDFRPSDISFENVKPTPEEIEAFVVHFLFKADGRATERLRDLLCG